ncbi:MAG: hypothetical protein O2894_04480 [Planctomycetota bacterium]|nr:hypothetical protein [Planctomycetota bacterium]
MTITKNGRHPDVPGNGYVPYYIIFDHTGKLRYHHMAGSYHGGDGLKLIELVDALLEDAPAIWLGSDPFTTQKDLAQRIASGKGLGASLKRLDAALEAGAEGAAKDELERLRAGVVRWRDRELAAALGFEASQPSEVLGALKDLQKTVKGTSYAAEVDAQLVAMEESKELAAAVKIEKDYRKIVGAYEKVKEDKRSDVLTERAVAKLEKLLEEAGELPFAQMIRDYLSNLR